METFPLSTEGAIGLLVAHLVGLGLVGWTKLPNSEQVAQVVDWIHSTTRSKNVQAVARLLVRLESRISQVELLPEASTSWNQEIEPVYDRIASRHELRERSRRLNKNIGFLRLASIFTFVLAFLFVTAWAILHASWLSSQPILSLVLFILVILCPWIVSLWTLYAANGNYQELLEARRNSEFHFNESTND